METVLCYYCAKNTAEPRYVFRKPLYKKLDSSYGIGLTGLKKTTKYYEKEVTVGRCAACYTEHSRSSRPALMTFLVTAVLAGVITGFLARRVFISLVVAVAAGIVGMVLYIILVYRKRLKELGMKDAHDVDAHPAVKQLLSEGWQNDKP